MGYQYNRIGAAPTDAHDGGAFDKFDHYQLEKQGQIWNNPAVAPQGMEASGGIVSDYTVGSDSYRAHIFASPGTFTVTTNAAGIIPDACEYMVIAGGGSGGQNHGAGGGAGGFITNLSGHPKVASPKTLTGSATGGNGSGAYPITVGAGSIGPNHPGPYPDSVNNGHGPNGNPSSIVVSPTVTYTAYGGGAGGTNNGGNPTWAVAASGVPGGSGGGWKSHSSPGDTFTAGEGDKQNSVRASTTTASGWPVVQGYDGGAGYHPNPGYGCGGGGGAGGVGGDAPGTSPSSVGGMGGVGVQCLIAGPATDGIGVPGPGGGIAWFAGGGGGGGDAVGSRGGGVKAASPDGPFSGGGDGLGGDVSNPSPLIDWTATVETNAFHSGFQLTGGGGGGGVPGGPRGGNGGPGCVIIRYKINSTQTSTAKATGGAISFTPTRAYHVFFNAGTFHYTDPNPVTLNALVVGGGGAGGQTGGGNGAGGGGGAVIEGSLPGITGPYPVAILVGAGAASGANDNGIEGGAGNKSSAAFPSHPVIAYGGGGGDGGSDAGAASYIAGGSGGGRGGNSPGDAGGEAQPTDSTTPTQFTCYGNNGGTGEASADGSGGGGGAGGVGQDGGTSGTAGDGGAGKNFPTWIPTAYGDGGYFGGGGGGVWSPGAGTGRPGGSGGGGDGYNPPGGITQWNYGQAGTGGGGGGGGGVDMNRSGGPGIVIISYPI